MFKRAALGLSVAVAMLSSQDALSALYVEQYSPEIAESTTAATKGADTDLVIYNAKYTGDTKSATIKNVEKKPFVYSSPAKAPEFVPPSTAVAPSPQPVSSGSKLATDVAVAVAAATKSPSSAVTTAAVQPVKVTPAMAATSTTLASSPNNVEMVVKKEEAPFIKEPSGKVLVAPAASRPTTTATIAPVATKPALMTHRFIQENLSEQLKELMANQKPAWNLVWKSGSDYEVTVPYTLQYKDPIDLVSQLKKLYGFHSKVFLQNNTVLVFDNSK